MIPTIIIGNHKNHNGSCNSNILLMIKNNTCSNNSFIDLLLLKKQIKYAIINLEKRLIPFPLEALQRGRKRPSIAIFLYA